jgi:DNA-binding transcriptional MerR regulator
MAVHFPSMTAQEAANLAGVQLATIRDWRRRGLLTPVRGSTPLRPRYLARDVLAASVAPKARRTNTPEPATV